MKLKIDELLESGEREKIREEVGKLVESRYRLEKQLESLSQENKELKDMLPRRDERIRDLEAIDDSLESRNAENKKYIQKIQREKRKLDKELEETKKKLKKSEKKIEFLKNRVEIFKKIATIREEMDIDTED